MEAGAETAKVTTMDPPAGTLAVLLVKDTFGPEGEADAPSLTVPSKPPSPARVMVRFVDEPRERVREDPLA